MGVGSTTVGLPGEALAAGPGPGSGAGAGQRGAERQGLRRRAARQHRQLGAHRLALADDLRPRLLCGRVHADHRVALRHRPHRHGAAREPAPVGRDDRGRHALQQDGAPRSGASTTRCRSPATSSRWEAAPMAAATTTTPIRWCAAATASSRSISTSPAVRPRPKRCSTASCNCSGRSGARGPSRASARGLSGRGNGHGRPARPRRARCRESQRLCADGGGGPRRARGPRTRRPGRARPQIPEGRPALPLRAAHRTSAASTIRSATRASMSSITCSA